MDKAKKTRMVLLVSAIVMELAAVILIVKSIVTGSSATQGVIILVFGLIFLVIGMRRKSENGKKEAS